MAVDVALGRRPKVAADPSAKPRDFRMFDAVPAAETVPTVEEKDEVANFLPLLQDYLKSAHLSCIVFERHELINLPQSTI